MITEGYSSESRLVFVCVLLFMSSSLCPHVAFGCRLRRRLHARRVEVGTAFVAEIGAVISEK